MGVAVWAWASEALPAKASAAAVHMNDLFFIGVPVRQKTEGERKALAPFCAAIRLFSKNDARFQPVCAGHGVILPRSGAWWHRGFLSIVQTLRFVPAPRGKRAGLQPVAMDNEWVVTCPTITRAGTATCTKFRGI